jgi:translation initiation factor IF-2
VEHAKNSLLEKGIYLEGLGGEIAYAQVSSKTGDGVSELLDLVLLAADLHELTADAEASATGFVLEATQDPKRGASATLVIKDGTLHLQSFVVAGDAYAPVRFIEDFRGARVESAGPSAPVRISGFSKLPSAGALFSIVKNKKEAEALAEENAKALVAAPLRGAATDGITELPLVIKADVAGSVDAITHELAKITHEKAAIRIISSGVGSVSEADAKSAYASGAAIIAFNVGTDAIARDLAEREKISIFPFSIIYELSTKVQELLTASIPSVAVEKELGRVLVLKNFSSSAKKHVLGARYVSGVITVGDRIRITRRDVEIARGKILNLQQARADVKEIKVEGDFGMEIESRESVAYGDEIVAFSISES